MQSSVPARLGKGQGAKEIGHHFVGDCGTNLQAFYKHFYTAD